jgi:RNA polymerase sigma factor for flagellar operon FliA
MTLRGIDLLLQQDRVEAALWRAHANQPGIETRQELFKRYRPFAQKIAAVQFAKRRDGNYEKGDIEQLAYEALLQAIERFDPARGVPFEAFARIRINGHISNGLAQTSEGAAQYRYRQRAERERLRSVSAGLDREAEGAIAALSRLSSAIALGLLLDEREAGAIEAIPDPKPTAYESLAIEQLRRRLDETVDMLPERENFVIRQHYRNGVSFQQIATLLGVSKGRISQIHRAALERLRSVLGKLG